MRQRLEFGTEGAIVYQYSLLVAVRWRPLIRQWLEYGTEGAR